MGTNSLGTNLAEKEMVDKPLSTDPCVYHHKMELVDRTVDTPNPLKNNANTPLSTFFSLKYQKEEKERKEGVLAHSSKSFETKVDTDEVVDTDLSTHPDPFAALTACLTFATEGPHQGKAAMRNRWGEFRGLVPADLAKRIMEGVE